MSKAEIGDYLPDTYSGIYHRVSDITENNGDTVYHMDNGLQMSDLDFSFDEIRLESEIL